MATYEFSTISTKGDLEKLLMQLRLRKLPLTLEVINAIRVAIQTQHLDESLHKTLEREFSGQWKDIQKKNNITDWPKNQWGKKLEPQKFTPPVPAPVKTKGHEETQKQKQKKQRAASNKKTKSPSHKNNLIRSSYYRHSDPEVYFPCNLNVPYIISTIQLADEILEKLRKYPHHIDYDVKNYIASHVRDRKILDYIRDSIIDIRLSSSFAQKKKNTQSIPQGSIVFPQTSSQENSISKLKESLVIIEKACESDPLYETFSYGLSDWDR